MPQNDEYGGVPDQELTGQEHQRRSQDGADQAQGKADTKVRSDGAVERVNARQEREEQRDHQRIRGQLDQEASHGNCLSHV